MANFDVEMVGDTPGEVSGKLDSMSSGMGDKTDEALLKEAREIKTKIEDTAPVDTGAYQGSWYIAQIDEDEVWILSSSDEAEHNKFLMLPNLNFVGSSGADLPAQGIYHNVEGIAKRHRKSFNSNVADEIAAFLNKFKSNK